MVETAIIKKYNSGMSIYQIAKHKAIKELITKHKAEYDILLQAFYKKPEPPTPHTATIPAEKTEVKNEQP
jgi:hypothetical protein